MLDKDKVRQLAYVVKVKKIEPIPGRDKVEAAIVGGWKVMVRKDTFQPGSLGVYFEIDSKVDYTKPEFAFTAKYKGKIKTQKFAIKDENGNKVGQFYSQGLLMPFEDLNRVAVDYKEGDFLTKELGVIYADAEDNKRKAKSDPNAKYKSMAGRHPKLFKNPIIKAIYKTGFGKKVLFLFFGRKTDKKREWPSHIVKTDEERVQNLAHLIPEYAKEKWIATEKVDGTSTTFSVIKGKGKKLDYYVCSRNVVMNQPGKDKTCYYAETDGNVYTEMSAKYDMETVLTNIFTTYNENDDEEVQFVTIQGETYGGSIQKRNYSIKEHDLAVFNVIIGYKELGPVRLNPIEGKELMDTYNVPYVPIIGEVEIPDNCDGILEMAAGASKIDGLPREGLVFRSLDGAKSFKAVDNEFICSYHK